MDRFCCDELMVFCGIIDYDTEAKREWECIECGRQIAEPYNPTLPAIDGSRVLLDRIKELEALLARWQGWEPKDGFERSENKPEGYYFCMACGGVGDTHEEIEHDTPCIVVDTEKTLGGDA